MIEYREVELAGGGMGKLLSDTAALMDWLCPELGIKAPIVKWFEPADRLRADLADGLAYKGKRGINGQPECLFKQEEAISGKARPLLGEVLLHVDLQDDPVKLAYVVAHELKHIAGDESEEAAEAFGQWAVAALGGLVLDSASGGPAPQPGYLPPPDHWKGSLPQYRLRWSPSDHIRQETTT